jgi:hypothetical protein
MNPIQAETQRFAFMLLEQDWNFTTFVHLPEEKQLAVCGLYGLSDADLAVALEQAVLIHRMRLERLRDLDAARKREAN